MPKWRDSDERRADRFGNYDKIRRRRQLNQQTTQIDPWERAEDEWVLGGKEGLFAARVVEVHKRYCFVSPEPKQGEIATKDPWLATVARRHLTSRRGERNFVTVGDRVLARPAADGDAHVSSELPVCVLEHMSPRRSRLARPDPMHPEREHVLAANIDQLVIVASYRTPKIRWALIDRYLVLAEEQSLPAIIVLTKEDLLGDDDFSEEAKQQAAVYAALGYPTFSLSVTKKRLYKPTIAALAEHLKGKFSIFSGHSGVGKSSLVNLFSPDIVQEVEPEPEGLKSKGRHTTTYASLIRLKKIGGFVVDTPGIRSFAIAERTSLEWSQGFREIRALVGQCKFRECRHIDEPECAVLVAVASGKIDARRYQSFSNLLRGETGREGRVRDSKDTYDIDEE